MGSAPIYHWSLERCQRGTFEKRFLEHGSFFTWLVPIGWSDSLIQDSHASLNLHPRQGNITVTQATFPGPKTVILRSGLCFLYLTSITSQDDHAVGPKRGPFSPYRLGGLEPENSNLQFPASVSPTRPFSANVHPGVQSSVHNVVTGGSYSSQKPSSAVNEDLSVALRGMAVEDDQQNHQSMLPQGPPLPRPHPYARFLDHNPHYTVPHGRESYIDFSYGYDAYRRPADVTMFPSPGISGVSPGSLCTPALPQGLHLNSVPGMRRTQQGIFFDYGVPTQPCSQFYYPHQPVMYSLPAHSPMTTSQLPATFADKEHEMQVRHRIVSYECVLNLVFCISIIFSSTSLLRILCTDLWDQHHSPTRTHILFLV